MFDKKISLLFCLFTVVIFFQAAPLAQNKRHIIQSIMGREDYVDKSYSYACTDTRRALYLLSVKALETRSLERLPLCAALNIRNVNESKLVFK